MEQPQLTRKYGLFTAVCMVVGIVIGSGVFFKAQTILQKTGGNMPLGIVAWVIGGAIMLACVLTFSFMAQKYVKVNGIVDYAEATVGPRYGYMVGWFMTVIYYPTLTMALSWLSARYTLVFLTSVNPDLPLVIPAAQGGCAIGPECMVLTLLYMCGAYALNALSPHFAGRFQTSTTIIKLIPLGLMAVGGVVYGLMNGMLQRNFETVVLPGQGSTAGLLFAAVCSTAFAYEGWIIATSINAELKNPKRNLPRALVFGSLVVIVAYISYYVGVAGGATNLQLMDRGATVAFTNLFGAFLGNVLNLFIAISCIGTMNGLMLATCRGMYALAARREGPAPRVFGQIDAATNVPNNSAVMGLLLCAAWFFYFYLSNLAGTFDSLVLFPGTWAQQVAFLFDPTELPIITIYGFYLPIFINWMRKEKDENFVRRFLIPSLAVLGACFMILACLVGHKWGNLWYLLVFAVIMLLGRRFRAKA